MNLRAYFLAILFLYPTLSSAGTDYACMSDCSAAGYMYQLCQRKCFYSENSGRGGRPMPENYQSLTDMAIETTAKDMAAKTQALQVELLMLQIEKQKREMQQQQNN